MMTVQAGAVDPFRIAERLERLPISAWHTKTGLIVSFAFFFDAFDALSIAYVLPVLVPLWKIAPADVGALISIGFAGQAIGAILFGYLAQRFGRAPVAIWTLLLFSVMSFACAFAWDYNSLFWMRFVQGFGLGGEIPVISAYLSEFAKAEKRARFLILFQIAFPIGLLAASLAGLAVVPTIGWHWMFIIGAFPALVAFPLRLMLQESPRWLASRGRFEEADLVLRKIEAEISENGTKPLPPVPTELPPAVVQSTRVLDLLSPLYLRRTISLWLLWICTYLVVYGMVGWLPTIWGRVFKLSVTDALWYGFIGSAVGLVATVVIAFLLDKVGRRIWFSIALVMSGLLLLPLWSAGAMAAPTVLVWVCLSLFWINTVAVSLATYTSENYPTHLRALGGGAAGAWQRLSSMAGPLLVGWVLPAYGIGAVFVMFAASAIVGGVVCFLFAIETKGRTLEQLSPAEV
jgi:putative MFS transporter